MDDFVGFRIDDDLKSTVDAYVADYPERWESVSIFCRSAIITFIRVLKEKGVVIPRELPTTKNEVLGK